MRRFALAAVLAALVAPAAHAQTQNQSGEINVFTPGVVYNSGIQDLAASYTKETGVKVTITSKGMAALINDAKTGTPVADIIVAPVSFMDGLEAEASVVPGTAADIGRVYIGVAVPKGKPHPDISSPRKLAAALKAGGTIIYSNPAPGSMEARIIDDMLHQNAIFKGVKTKISTKGEGGEALVRGEGQMALQLSCEILNHPELEQVGLTPESLRAYIDTDMAISPRSANADQAAAFIAYVKSPEGVAVLKSKGMVPAK
jgi:molybdate transport system substrate-binding protein